MGRDLRLSSLFGLLLLFGGACASAQARPTPSPSDSGADRMVAAPSVERGVIALSHFSAKPGPARLTDASAALDLDIPLAKTRQMEDAIIDLHYTNSIALEASRSAMLIRFNGTTLAQIRLDPGQPVGVATVRLPRELWRPGYNKLTIGAVQHYTNACEDPESPELWTEVDLSRSTLSYGLGPIKDASLLSSLDGLFSPGLGAFDRVLMLTAPGSQAERLRAEALPLVAQALALRRRFAPLAVDYSDWRDQGNQVPSDESYLPDGTAADAAQVLVGTPDQLARILPAKAQPVVDGPKLVLNDLGKGRVRLIVTGRTPDEVVAAARDLTVMDDPLTPDSQVTFVDGPKAGSAASRVDDGYLSGGKTYRFGALGLSDTTISGTGPNQIRVQLPLPADFYTAEAAQADLSLDFAYGAGMGPGSVLNIMVNGEFVHGLLLDNPGGASFHDYRIHVPVRLMVPGINDLDFQVTMRPQLAGGQCLSIKGRHLMLQLMASSTISLPEAGHAAVLPDLTRFANAGFPYISDGSEKAGRIFVSSPELIGSALTLVGKIAEAAHTPVDGWQIEVGIPDKITGRAIVLATTDAMPADVFGQWSAAVGRAKAWPYRTLAQLRSVREGNGLHFASLAAAQPASPAVPASPTMTQRSGLGNLGVLGALRNPNGAGADSLMMVVTADNVATLSARVHDLVQPELWGQMKGDLVAWQDVDSPMMTMEVGEHYQVGNRSPWLLLQLTLSNNPWYWLAGVIASIVVAVGCATYLLHHRRRRLEGGQR